MAAPSALRPDTIAAIMNFTPVPREGYSIGLPPLGALWLVYDGDA